MLIASACGHTWVDEAKEELLPILPRLKEVMDDFRVVVGGARIHFVPRMTLKPP
jgi:hypothetical protein